MAEMIAIADLSHPAKKPCELKSKYKHSVLGWAWSLINPAASLAIYTLVFSTIFRALPPPAHNGMTTYVIYLFIALVAWNFFSNVVNGSMAALIGAGPLLKKIYFPAYAPVIGNSVSALVQTLIGVGCCWSSCSALTTSPGRCC